VSLSGTTTVLRLFGFGTSRQPMLREVAPWEEIG